MNLLEYLIKFSLWIGVLWIFYKLFLYQLTFHNWKRVYLLGYSCLAFVVPLLDLAAFLQIVSSNENNLLARVPVVQQYIWIGEDGIPSAASWIVAIVSAGALLAVARLLMQYVSYRRIRSRAELLYEEGGVNIYSSENLHGAFSFGNSIYINPGAHTEDELKRILHHEIVHVKQKHTIDLVISELICVVNWFNPFAWLLRKSIKENLEFIADQNVLSAGADRSQYQYLLLKVTALPNYQILSHFNISDLKNRIAMMNKLKSAKLHLSRFLFAVPLFAIILVAFRTEQTQAIYADSSANFVDTIPPGEDLMDDEPSVDVNAPEFFNNKGYSLSVITTNGQAIVLIREKGSKGVHAMTLAEWNKNRGQNEKKYGKLPPPPPPAPAPPAPPAPSAPSARSADVPPAAPAAPAAPPAPPAPPVPPTDKSRNSDVTISNTVQNLVNAQAELKQKQQIVQEVQVDLHEKQVKLQHARQELQVHQQKLVEVQVNLQKQQNINTNIEHIRPSKKAEAAPK
jgi:hypothetical protein